MNFRTLGATGIRVTPLCLGAMMFGAVGNPDHDECVRIIHRALDAGINFVDTADAYGTALGDGMSEQIIGRWFAQGGGRREKTVIATVEAGFMTKDLSLLVGPDQPWLTTEGFIEKVATNFQDAMAKA